MDVYWGVTGDVGDEVCFLSACRTYAKTTGDTVYVRSFDDVVRSCGDDLIRISPIEVREFDLQYVHLDKAKYEHSNYLGMALDAMIPGSDPQPEADLPNFSYEPPRCLIQPYSGTARNPSDEYLQSVVDAFVELTGETLYAVGHDGTPHRLRNVDYSLLQNSVPALMAHIQHARFVLTPRSGSAHIAAMYKTPCMVWLPDDGLDWHMNYKKSPLRLVHYSDELDKAGMHDFYMSTVRKCNNCNYPAIRDRHVVCPMCGANA